MAFTYLVTRDEILQRTVIGGNTDQDKIAPHIVTAQDIELQTVLGTSLYNKVMTDFANNTIAEPYITLLDTYIKPMLCHYVAANFYVFHAFSVANGGIYRHQSENSFTPSLQEVELLSNEQKAKAVHYRERLIDYICWNTSLFPEYLTNQNDGMSPRRNTPPNQIYF